MDVSLIEMGKLWNSLLAESSLSRHPLRMAAREQFRAGDLFRLTVNPKHYCTYLLNIAEQDTVVFDFINRCSISFLNLINVYTESSLTAATLKGNLL